MKRTKQWAYGSLWLDGNKVKQAEAHKEKMLAFAAQMKGAKLSQFECRDAVETAIYKSLEYPLCSKISSKTHSLKTEGSVNTMP